MHCAYHFYILAVILILIVLFFLNLYDLLEHFLYQICFYLFGLFHFKVKLLPKNVCNIQI